LRRACSSGKVRERCAGPGRHRAVIGIGLELAQAPGGDEPLGGQSPTSHARRRGDGQGSEACGLVGLGAGGILVRVRVNDQGSKPISLFLS
jgi:hypothetical protein